MGWDQVPLEEQQVLYREFTNNPEIKEMQDMSDFLVRHQNFLKACEIRSKIKDKWEEVKQHYCKTNNQVIEETIKLSELNLSQDTLQPLLENILTVFMCCDIIETSYLNANELLKKVDKSYSIDNFSDLVSLIQNIKKKLDYLRSTTGYMDDFIWGDSCDKYYDMLKGKARSILKKKDDINRWGKSLKKYIDGTL